jgi:hypothetical protein
MEYHGFDIVNDAPARVSDEELNRKLHHHRMEGSKEVARKNVPVEAKTHSWACSLQALL